MITEINHYNIRSTAELMEEIKDFYIDVLGFEVGFRPSFPHDGYWLYSNGKALLHLNILKEAIEPGESYFNHIAFTVSELDSYKAKLEERGIEYRSYFIEDVKQHQIFFKDVCGVNIELNYSEE